MRYLRTRILISVVLLSRVLLMAQSGEWASLANALQFERDGNPQQALSIVKELRSSKAHDPLLAGKSWDISGLVYEDLGNLSQASYAFEQAIHILKNLPGHSVDYAMAVDNLGGLYFEMGELGNSKKLKLQALRVYEKVGYHAGIAISSSDLAGLSLTRGKLRDARGYLARAEREEPLAEGMDDDNRAAISSMRGWMASADHMVQDAIHAYEHSLDLWRNQHGEEHPFTGWGYVLLGKARVNAGESQRGIDDMERGMNILARTLGKDNPRYLIAQIAYANSLDHAGAHAQSRRLRDDAERRLQALYRGECLGCTIDVGALR